MVGETEAVLEILKHRDALLEVGLQRRKAIPTFEHSLCRSVDLACRQQVDDYARLVRQHISDLSEPAKEVTVCLGQVTRNVFSAARIHSRLARSSFVALDEVPVVGAR